MVGSDLKVDGGPAPLCIIYSNAQNDVLWGFRTSLTQSAGGTYLYLKLPQT